MFFLGSVLYFFIADWGQVFFRAYFWTNILVWLFARPANHIGASGVVYALAFFLIFFGLFRRDFLSLFISMVVIILYGRVFYGVLPTDPAFPGNHIWQEHWWELASAITFSKRKECELDGCRRKKNIDRSEDEEIMRRFISCRARKPTISI